MLGGFLAGRGAARFAPATLALAGRIIACLGLSVGLVAGVLSPSLPLPLFIGAVMCVGLGNGITMPGANAAALSVRPDLAGAAAGVNGALIVAMGAALTTLTGLTLPAEAPALPLLALMLAASGRGAGGGVGGGADQIPGGTPPVTGRLIPVT